MSLDATTTSPADWKYISEGGASIVFSYAGPPNSDFAGTALRLRKVHNDNPVTLHPITAEATAEPDDPSIVFQREVIQRLVSPEYLPRLEPATVDRQWLQKLHELNQENRPLDRRTKDAIDLGTTKAVLATDLVGGQGLAVEIKPKWGFLPSSTHLSPATKSIKTTTCRFCMHAHLKSTEGEDVSLGYCPLDLFSGDEGRVTQAIHALWDVWLGSSGGVNNLRAFVHGQMLRPSMLPISLAPLAAQVLPVDAQEPSLDDLRDAFTAIILPILMQTPVLQKLSNLQRTLDALDIEGLSALWAASHAAPTTQEKTIIGSPDTATPPPPHLGQGLKEPTLADWHDFIDIYHTKHTTMDHDNPDVANLQYYCLAYLLSATFKDCSIIIRVPPAGRASVTVIDLDVKSVNRLHSWAKLDERIVLVYKGIAEPRICKDF